MPLNMGPIMHWNVSSILNFFLRAGLCGRWTIDLGGSPICDMRRRGFLDSERACERVQPAVLLLSVGCIFQHYIQRCVLLEALKLSTELQWC